MKRNVLPLPGSARSTRPPISPTSRSTIVSPSPLPPYFRVVDESAWVKAEKILAQLVRADADAGIGDAEPQVRRVFRCRIALDPNRDFTRFGKLDRVADQVGDHLSQAQRISTSRVGTSDANRSVSSNCFSSARTARVSMVFSTTSASSKAVASRLRRPLSIRARSSTLLMSSSSALPLLTKVPT